MQPLLNLAESKSDLWLKLRRHLTQTRANLVESLVRDKSENETAKLRGRIEEIDRMLTLEPPDPADEAKDAGVTLLPLNTE